MIRSFSYRTPRLTATFPLAFHAGGGVFQGVCLDVSPDGLRARMQDTLPCGVEGLITLVAPCRSVQLLAIVANVEAEHAGFAFRGIDPAQLEAIARLLAEAGAL